MTTTTCTNPHRVAVVTGAAQGVGRATSELLAKNGWSVVAADRDEKLLGWTAGRTDILPCVADIATEAGNQAMVDLAVEKFGGLRGLILNAGVSLSGPIDTLEMEAFDTMAAVNLRGPILGIRAALPYLRAGGGGSIAVTASGYALGGDAGFWAYAATKHGLIGMVRSVAREIAAEGIRINAACPSAIRGTGLSGPIETVAPEIYKMIASAIPMQRWCEAEEVASVLEFLISDASSFVNGAAIPIDGGALTGVGLLGPNTSSAAF